MNSLEVFLSAGSGAVVSAVVVKGLDLAGVFGKNKSDRTTARETLADVATKTALEALRLAVDELRRDVETEKGRRTVAETKSAQHEETIEGLRAAVETLSERIEEQNRELADQPKLKAENLRLRRQVTELQKQVSDLKARTADLEQARAERISLESEILRVQAKAAATPQTVAEQAAAETKGDE